MAGFDSVKQALLRILLFMRKLGWDTLVVIGRHKFKSIILALLLYATYKTYGLYRSFKEMTSGMSEIFDKKTLQPDKPNLSISEKTLLNYLTG